MDLIFILHDNKGNQLTYMGATNAGDGMLAIYNDNEVKVVHLGSGDSSNGGILTTYNKYATNTTYLGTAIEDQELILINNKYGDEKWRQ